METAGSDNEFGRQLKRCTTNGPSHCCSRLIERLVVVFYKMQFFCRSLMHVVTFISRKNTIILFSTTYIKIYSRSIVMNVVNRDNYSE